MERLNNELTQYILMLPADKATPISEQQLERLKSVYPFNKFEYIISHLLADDVLTLDRYLDIRNDYLERNRYLHLFELAPRTFGETWGQNYLRDYIPDFVLPNKNLDHEYSGEYDLWYHGLKVEVKASRAVEKKGGGTLTEKALSFGSMQEYDMNFQQLKPGCCDVFIWIAVWTDQIEFWVIPAADLKDLGLSNQHRGSQVAKDGEIIEGQIHINNLNHDEFNQYKVSLNEISGKLDEKLQKNA